MHPTSNHVNRWSVCLATMGILTFGSLAEEPWKEVKDIRGRTLTVKIEKVENDNVTFTTKNGKTHTLAITKFSLTDQLAFRKWKPAPGSTSPVKADATLAEVKSTDTQTVLRTKHFEYDVVGQAKADQIEEIAQFFEAIYHAFSELPIDVTPKPAESHFQVKVYLTDSDFEISAQEDLGAEQPAVFNLGKNQLLAPLPRLKPSPALAREVAYTLLGQQLETLPPWLAVAVTETIAAAPYQKDALIVDMNDPLANMKEHLAKVYGLTAKTIPSLPPTAVAALDYRKLRAEGLEGNKSRSSALISFYFFAYLDRKGKGMENYMRAIKVGTAPDEAFATLANEREADVLGDALKVAYLPKQMRIAFIQ